MNCPSVRDSFSWYLSINPNKQPTQNFSHTHLVTCTKDLWNQKWEYSKIVTRTLVSRFLFGPSFVTETACFEDFRDCLFIISGVVFIPRRARSEYYVFFKRLIIVLERDFRSSIQLYSLTFLCWTLESQSDNTKNLRQLQNSGSLFAIKISFESLLCHTCRYTILLGFLFFYFTSLSKISFLWYCSGNSKHVCVLRIFRRIPLNYTQTVDEWVYTLGR